MANSQNQNTWPAEDIKFTQPDPSFLPSSSSQNMNTNTAQTIDEKSWHGGSIVPQSGSSYGDTDVVDMDADDFGNNNGPLFEDPRVLDNYLDEQSYKYGDRYGWADDPKLARNNRKKQVVKQIRDAKGSSPKHEQKHRPDDRHHNDTHGKKSSSRK